MKLKIKQYYFIFFGINILYKIKNNIFVFFFNFQLQPLCQFICLRELYISILRQFFTSIQIQIFN